MDRKLVIIDLDGTTLNSKEEISENTQKVIKKILNAGHIVSIATGRPFRTSSRYYSQLELDTPIINFNGALVHKPFTKWLPEKELSIRRDVVFEILEEKEKLQLVFVSAENRNTFFVDSLVDFDSRFFIAPLASKGNLLSNLKQNPTAIFLKTSHGTKQSVAKHLLDKFGNEVDIRVWGDPHPIIEIVPKGVNKAISIPIIAESYGFNRKNIMVFGDEYNDIEMFKYAGWSVAMSNGVPPLRAIASDVTDRSNNDEGLASYLEQYFNLDM